MMAKLHVDKSSKIGQNASTPPPPSSIRKGPVFTTTSQYAKYLTISGIEVDTYHQEWKWPKFAVKELGDNGDDFFKVHYPSAPKDWRKIATKIVIDTKSYPGIGILRVAVLNSNVDKNIPVFENLEDTFDFDKFGSTKRSQHNTTAGGLGDFLKRILGMGYASWTGHDIEPTAADNNDNAFYEDKQWQEPVILRFDGKQYKVYLDVKNKTTPIPRIEGPIKYDAPDFTEVEVALPLLCSNWKLGSTHNTLLIELEKYHKTFKAIKRNVDFSFTKEIV